MNVRHEDAHHRKKTRKSWFMLDFISHPCSFKRLFLCHKPLGVFFWTINSKGKARRGQFIFYQLLGLKHTSRLIHRTPPNEQEFVEQEHVTFPPGNNTQFSPECCSFCGPSLLHLDKTANPLDVPLPLAALWEAQPRALLRVSLHCLVQCFLLSSILLHSGTQSPETFLNFLHALPAFSSLVCSASPPLICCVSVLSFYLSSFFLIVISLLIFALFKVLSLHILYTVFVLCHFLFAYSATAPPLPRTFFYVASFILFLLLIPPSLPLSILPPCALVLFELKRCKSEIRL